MSSGKERLRAKARGLVEDGGERPRTPGVALVGSGTLHIVFKYHRKRECKDGSKEKASLVGRLSSWVVLDEQPAVCDNEPKVASTILQPQRVNVPEQKGINHNQRLELQDIHQM